MQRSTRNLLAATSLVVGIWARPADAFQPPAALAAPAPAPTIVDVQVAGNKNVARERILSHVGFLKGRPFDAETIRRATAQLNRTALFHDVKSEYEDGPEGRILRFTVLERHNVREVRFVGNKAFSNDKLVEYTGLRPGGAMDPGLNKMAAQEITRRYREKGYAFVDVQVVEGGRRDDVNVVIQIDEGPKTKIKDIQFPGAQFVSQSRLRTRIKSGRFFGVGRFGVAGEYDEQQVEEDVAALKQYYQSNGFLDVKVAPQKEFTPDKEWVRLTYAIDEGQRYTIGEIRLAGVSKLPEADLRKKIDEIRLVGGKTYDEGSVKRAQQELKDAYGKQGYVNADVAADLVFHQEPGRVDVVYQIREDAPKILGDVRIEGNTVTKNRVIRQILDLEPGTLLDTTKLRQAQMNLIDSRLFLVDATTAPTVEVDPAGDPLSPQQNLLVNLKEAPTGSLMFGVGVNSDNGVGGSLVVHERNFDLFRLPTSWSDLWSGNAWRGAGQELRLEAVPGDLVNRYAVTFLEPRLLGSDYSLQTSGYYYNRIFYNYHEQRTGGRFTFGKRINREWGAALTLRMEDVGISQPTLPAPVDLLSVLGHHFLYGPRLALTHDTRDSQMNPTKGHFIEAGYEHTFGDYDFPRINVAGRQFFNVWSRRDGSGKHILGLRGEVGWTGDNTPMFERWFVGGFQTFRGFQFRGVGPSFFDQKVGGNFMVLGSAEYYLPLSADDNLGWVFFVDSGTVESKVELLDYRVSAGFGLRVRVPGMGPVPLAFDFGFPIVKTNTDEVQVFSFSVGIFR